MSWKSISSILFQHRTRIQTALMSQSNHYSVAQTRGKEGFPRRGEAPTPLSYVSKLSQHTPVSKSPLAIVKLKYGEPKSSKDNERAFILGNPALKRYRQWLTYWAVIC